MKTILPLCILIAFISLRLKANCTECNNYIDGISIETIYIHTDKNTYLDDDFPSVKELNVKIPEPQFYSDLKVNFWPVHRKKLS